MIPKVEEGIYASEIMKSWIQLYTETSLIHQDDLIYKKIFTKPNLAAYVLHPANKEKQLCSNQKSQLRFFIAKALQNSEEYEKFDEYLEGDGEFGREELLDLDVKTYWTMMKGYCPSLSDLALKFTSLPAICKQKMKKVNTPYSVSLDSNVAQKVSVIKSSL